MPPEIAQLIALFQRGAYDQVITLAARLKAAFPREALIPVVAGAAYAELGAWAKAETWYNHALAIDPESVDAHYNLGLALQRQGKVVAAEAAYRTVLAAAPGHVQARNNFAVVLREQSRHAEARTQLEQALSLAPDFVDALVNQGITLKHLCEPKAAWDSLHRAISLDPDCADGWYNLGLVLADLEQSEGAAAAFERARDLRPAHRESHHNLGLALVNLGRVDEAVIAYKQGLTHAPDDPQGWTDLGLAQLDQGDTAAAIAAWERALACDPGYYRALGLKRFNQLCIGDWSDTAPLPDPPEGAGSDGRNTQSRVGSPLSFIALDDNPARQRRIAQLTAAESFAQILPKPFAAVRGPEGRRLRIAYFSADFNTHPVAQLMVGVLAAHDRQRFEVFACSHSKSPRDAMTDRIAASVDHFLDIATMPDHAVLDLARRQPFDIAIDLAGHTRGSRTGLFGHRIAPVQIAYLGYPGTIGAPFIDYLVADARVIPPEQRDHYEERLILLPGSFQPNDDQRPLEPCRHSRADYNLPERRGDGGGFVFCCFNNTYKITHLEWDVWMRLLGAIPGSVLWLSQPVPQAEANFRREAAKRGIDPSRIVFADRTDYCEHIARHSLADLFLDTFRYNAHTTASDALWAGLPVLTLAGRSFAARVAASLLHAADLPELVTTSTAAYEALALALARNPQRLGELRSRLVQSRKTCALFDTARTTRNLEAGYTMAVARNFAGLPPANLIVPDQTG